MGRNSKTMDKILLLLKAKGGLSKDDIAKELKSTKDDIYTPLQDLRELGYIRYVPPGKGQWMLCEKVNEEPRPKGRGI
jgi:predicted ArsR family transcriptional regulator